MRAFLHIALAWFLVQQTVLGQAGKPQVWVATIADLQARRSIPDEVVYVGNLRTNVLWPEPRAFWAYSRTLVTNAHDGVHYVTNASPGYIYASADRGAPEQNAAWWGAVGNGSTDDTAALNAASLYTAQYVAESEATTLSGQGYGTLVIPPTRNGYLITNTLVLRSSTRARGAAVIYRGPTNNIALAVGPEGHTNTFINNHRFDLPDVWGWNTGFYHDSIGVQVRSIGRSTINFGYIYRFGLGIELLGDREATTLNTLNDGFVDTCRRGISLLATNGGYVNGNTWVGLRVNAENPNFKPGTTNGYEVVTIRNIDGSINGNTWLGGSWEGFPGQRLIYITNASANTFQAIRLEHHVSDYTNVVGSSLYMEVASEVSGRGIDNRFIEPSQGVNGMVGIQVKEEGYAYGNAGSSSQWRELRSRDNGYNHGPVVLTPSTNAVGQAMLTVYPYLPWPSNHWTHYDRWLALLATSGQRWKLEGDAGFRHWLEPNGNMTWASGASTYQPLAIVSSGMWDGYDDSQVRRIRVDRTGTLRFYSPTTGAVAGSLRPHHGSTFGGMLIADSPTNSLAGWTSVQDLGSGNGASAGLDVIGGGPTNQYTYLSYGTYNPSHPHGLIQDKSGFYLFASASNAYGSKAFTIALPNDWTDFEVIRGPVTTPSLKVDKSTTSGETRLSVWEAASASLKKVKSTAGILHFDSLSTNLTTLISNATPAGISMLIAANVSAQQALLGLAQMAFVSDAPADSKQYGRKDGAWSEITNSGSGSTYTNFWPDLTNALRAGANVTLTLDPTNHTATYAATASGSSNGTPVSIDGGSTLAALNIQSTATVEWANVGTNGSASVKADSLGTNHLSAAAESYLLNRTNHTGTQTLSTISDAGALAALNDAPTNGLTHGRKDGAWVVMTNSGSGGGTVTLSNLVQRVGWAEWETVLDWSSGTATGTVQNASLGGAISAVYTPSGSTNGVAGMPPFPDNPFGVRSMRVNLAGTGITTNTVFVLKRLSLQTTNVASSSYTNSGWTSADYLLLQASLVSTNVPLIVDIDPGFSTIAAGTGLDLHTWTNRFRMDLFEVSNVDLSAGAGPTNLVSSAASGLAPQVTLPDAVLTTDVSTNVLWGSKWMPVTAITGTTHTLVLSNAGQYLRLTSASSCEITVPAGTNVAYSLGTEIVVRVAAAGIPTLAAQAGVTLNGTNVVGSLIQHSTFGLKLVESTSTNWVWDVL